ncbi:MAG: hypothetical protein JOY73_11770 [Actinobacteria bacterium]|nr:hypothetical protein [Actinomycetota bacterium]
MKSSALLLAASLLFLWPATGSASRQTTSPGQYFTIRVTVTNAKVTLSPTHAPRGSTAIFLLANYSSASRVVALGDATLKGHRGTGFAVKLARNEEKRILVYLTYRGPLPCSIISGGKTTLVGVFRVT